MQELGNIQRALNPWAVFNPWSTQENGPKFDRSNESSRFHVSEEAEAAMNPWAVFNPWTTQETQQTSEGSNESSRFYVSDEAKSAKNPWAVFNPWSSQETRSTLEINTSTQNQIQAEPYKAILCQGNLGPRRVLNMLRDNIAQLNNSR